MKIGLVVEGGASRTFYSCGVMDEMLRENIYADYVIGTSAGISNAVSYVSKQIGRNYIIGTKYLNDKRYMGTKYLLNPKKRCYFNLDFIMDEIPNKLVPFDYDTFASFKGDVIATLTNINTGRTEYVPVSRYDRRFEILRATCALPLLFQPIIINGNEYLDGGITDSIPFQHAFDDGCDKCIVILTQARDYRKQADKTLEISAKRYRKKPEFAKALLNRPQMYNKQLEDIKMLEEQGLVYVIAPKQSLGINRTESNPEIIEKIYKQGKSDLRIHLDKLKDFIANKS